MTAPDYGSPDSGWVPEFDGQRPPFAPGNELAVQHGVYSPRKVEPLAQELVDGMLADPGTAYLREARWRPALWAWARAEAQVQLATEYLHEKAAQAGNGVGDLADERVKSAHLLLHRAEARADRSRARLGLDPLSAARLGKDRTAAALDAAQLMAQLEKQERERQEGEG
jgi:hypothetical protein